VAVIRWATFGLIDDAKPLVGAWVKGGLIGIGISLAAAALSQTVNRELRFVALLLEKVFECYPVASAGILIGGACGLVWWNRK
jgi:hypothetical protein